MNIPGWQRAEIKQVCLDQTSGTHAPSSAQLWKGSPVWQHLCCFSSVGPRSSARDFCLTLDTRCLSASLLPQPFQFISVLVSSTAASAGPEFPLTLRRLPRH